MPSHLTIRDPIHGDIQLTETEKRLLDSPSMQRLRKIRQLAMAHLVYPGANHTRFEHSLGTMELAERLCQSCGISREEKEKIRLSSLLHDIGHICFSHESEAVTKEFLGSHETIGRKRIEKGEISDILKENWDPKEISQLSFSNSSGSLISSDIGSDRMDYLLRDAHYTGVAYGVIDKERIISTCAFDKDGLYLKYGALAAAESLLLGRFLMYSAVYMHPTVRIASAMLQRALSLALRNNAIDREFLLSAGDDEVLLFLKNVSECKRIITQLQERRLFKKAFIADSSSIPLSHIKKIEEEIESESDTVVIVDFPQSFVRTINVKIEDESGKIVNLERLSPLVSSLSQAERLRLKIIVCCEKQDVAKVQKVAKKLISEAILPDNLRF
ncbi:MAG: HD domain-containing protein [Candidatus Anstonellales archaeon]